MGIHFETEIIFRLILAAVLGGAIGLEREVHGREAGLRTYLLVSLGSALMMVVSEYLLFNLDLKSLEGSSGRTRAESRLRRSRGSGSSGPEPSFDTGIPSGG